MRLFRFTIILILGGFFYSINADGQVIIKGVIIDQNTQKPIPNAHIFVETAEKASISDLEGLFEINIPKLPVLLSVSHLAYHLKAIVVEQVPTNKLGISLVSKSFQVDEVVVVAERVQQFFKKEFFYVKEMEFGNGFMWVVGYPDKNILNPELRVLNLAGESQVKYALKKSPKLFVDALGEVYMDFKDSLNQLFWDGDSIHMLNTFIKDGTEEYLFSLQTSFDSLAILKRRVGTGVYNEFYAFNFKDSSQSVFHYSFDHELFASSQIAKRHQYGSIPTIVFPPFRPGRNARISASFDPTDGFTAYAQDRLLTYTPINSKLFKLDDHFLIFEDKGPFLWSYNFDLSSNGMVALQLPENSSKIDLLQDPVTKRLIMIYQQKGLQYLSYLDPESGKLLKTMRLDGFTFVENMRIYGNRVYYLDQSRAGARIMNLYSMNID